MAVSLTLTCPASSGQVSVPYSSSLVASGGAAPYTYSLFGSLPPGLTLDTSSGAITGTPSTAGIFIFRIQVMDSSGNTNPFTYCTITISGPTLSLTCPASSGQVSVPYSSSLVASGGTAPYTYSILFGSLPPGLTLNTSTGAITGIPTTAGAFTFKAQVMDSLGNTNPPTYCTITISGPALSLTCAASSGQVSVPYSSSLVASGGVAPYTYSIASGSLPPGLTLNTSTGAITGTPTTAGAFNFTAKVVDSSGNTGFDTVTRNCSISIRPALSLTCAASSGQVSVPYSSSLVASGGVTPYTYSIASGSLPPGLTLNTSTGAITGTPTTAGTFNFTAQVVDSSGNTGFNTVVTNCSITIASLPSLACASATGQVGSAYSSALVGSGGIPPYTYSIASGSLPPGLTLNSSTGAITGTPTTAGTFNFIAKLVDSSGNPNTNTVTSNCSITITSICSSPLNPITFNVHESGNNASEIVWFNSHLTKLGGTLPTSDFQLFVTGGTITFGTAQLSVPDAVISFSSSVSCAQTTFNIGTNTWQTTLPLSAASQADEIFIAGLAYELPQNFAQNVSNVTWDVCINKCCICDIVDWWLVPLVQSRVLRSAIGTFHRF